MVTLLVSIFSGYSNSAEISLKLFNPDSVVRESLQGTLNLSLVNILTRDAELNSNEFRDLLASLNDSPNDLPNILLPGVSSSEADDFREYSLSLINRISSSEWVLSGSSEGLKPASLVLRVSESGGIRATVRDESGSMLILRENDSNYILKSTLGAPTGHDPSVNLTTTVANNATVSSANSQNSGLDPSNSVDLLVVTTADSAFYAGGTNLLNQSIQAAVTDTNAGFVASNVDLQIRLVAIEPTDYIETNNTVLDWERLWGTSDGFLNEVHTLRDQHSADLVMLIIGEGDHFCGVAGWWTNGTNLLAQGGFSVLTEYCIPTTIFAHELGHNFGLQHDRFTNNDGGFQPYAHGYVAPSESWYTIMAYPNGCNFNCSPLNRWSNPSQKINGEPLGVPIGNIDAADNVAAINLTKSDVANFRVAANATSTELNLHTSCLAGNGRFDLNVINPEASTANYRLEFEGLSAREIDVVPKKWSRIRISGRPPGDYQVVVKKNGNTILDTSLSIDCSVTTPQVSLPEITPMSTCLNSNGLVMFQMVNPSGSSRPYVIEFDGVSNRSTTAAPFGQTIRGTSGRPDGTYGFVVKTGGSALHSGFVNVDCD